MLRKITLQKTLRATAILILIVGACIGYDLGDKMLILGQTVTYQFDFWLALFIWFISFAFSLLFWSTAKVLDLLENK